MMFKAVYIKVYMDRSDDFKGNVLNWVVILLPPPADLTSGSPIQAGARFHQNFVEVVVKLCTV